MSTTVTYKGSTLTTVDNQTRTLKTAGKYMEGDVTLTDVSSTIVVSETYDTNGGIIKTITTTGDTTNLQAKTVTPSSARQTINPDTGYVGMSQVVVEAASGTTINNQNKTVNPSISQQTITADSGYTGLGTVTVTAMPIMTLPTTAAASATSGYTSKLTISRSTSDQYINIPTGYNSAGAYYKISAVANGTEGTPTATKGTVSNHSVSVTPSVTNTAGYISGSTKMGTAVTVSASELVSGSQTITQNSTVDVTNLAEVVVSVEGGDTSWQTLYDGSVQVYSSSPNYFQISPYTTAFQSGQTYRVTWGQTQYLCTTIAVAGGATYDGYAIGNLSIAGAGADTGEPFIIYRNSATELTGGTTSSAGTESLKIELQQNSSSPELQSKTVTPTESQQTVQADSGYDGLDTVTVNAISSTYVGSGIARKSSTDLTVSGATVTAPAGYYSAAASKSVATMTLPTAATSSATSGYTSKATIGRSTAAQYINIPPGYNSAGAYYVISATPNGRVTAPSSISGTAASVSAGTNTLTLTKTISVTPNVTTAGYISSGTAGNSSVSLTANVTTQAAKTVTPTESSQTAVAANVYTTGAVTVGAISSTYVGSGVTTKAAATYTPTTTNQTIAAGTYLTGAQTIAGDADLVGSNILSTANIFGVQGTVDFIDVYIRSAAPTSSVGSDGDIYIQE